MELAHSTEDLPCRRQPGLPTNNSPISTRKERNYNESALELYCVVAGTSRIQIDGGTAGSFSRFGHSRRRQNEQIKVS